MKSTRQQPSPTGEDKTPGVPLLTGSVQRVWDKKYKYINKTVWGRSNVRYNGEISVLQNQNICKENHYHIIVLFYYFQPLGKVLGNVVTEITENALSKGFVHMVYIEMRAHQVFIVDYFCQLWCCTMGLMPGEQETQTDLCSHASLLFQPVNEICALLWLSI